MPWSYRRNESHREGGSPDGREKDRVLDYNRKMGAVDKADMINSFVVCTQKSIKWYKNIFFHLINTAVLNGHIVHRQLTSEIITEQVVFLN
jgi:hypothetical protein